MNGENEQIGADRGVDVVRMKDELVGKERRRASRIRKTISRIEDGLGTFIGFIRSDDRLLHIRTNMCSIIE